MVQFALRKGDTMAEIGPKQGTNSIYLDDETARMARELVVPNHISLSDIMKKAIRAAYQAKDSPYGMSSIYEYPSMSLDGSHDLDEWISLDSTKRVFLMGTTMRNPIVNYFH